MTGEFEILMIYLLVDVCNSVSNGGMRNQRIRRVVASGSRPLLIFFGCSTRGGGFDGFGYYPHSEDIARSVNFIAAQKVRLCKLSSHAGND